LSQAKNVKWRHLILAKSLVSVWNLARLVESAGSC